MRNFNAARKLLKWKTSEQSLRMPIRERGSLNPLLYSFRPRVLSVASREDERKRKKRGIMIIIARRFM